ncbi:hypothetical protein T11_7377 [Trichinella zimbabwensis]|uniref:Uncharacterized protein n=1 Tax=Trichinella zimbabwensis TaxID=268475 RepID=A0A0V1H9R9_9BILA|nr:hypothetical protein T11_7377 [Trichinella zimbabwensis]
MDQVVSQLVRQVQALQAQLASRKPTVLAFAVGGLPDSKHLDGTNYSEWNFAMKNYFVDAGLWHCVENENADHQLDQQRFGTPYWPLLLTVQDLIRRMRFDDSLYRPYYWWHNPWWIADRIPTADPWHPRTESEDFGVIHQGLVVAK